MSLPNEHWRIAVGMLATVALPVGESLESTIVLVSAVFTLFLVPSLFSLMLDLRIAFVRRFAGS